MRKITVISIVVLMAAAGALFFYRDTVRQAAENVVKNLQNFKKNEVGVLVDEIKREIFAPAPLIIGGKQNQAVLGAQKIIAQTNIARYDNGQLPPLTENARLDAAAKAKAQDMFAKQYFEHVSPSGVDPGALVKDHGYDYVVTGENLILGNFTSEKEAVDSWMNSPGHRANILHSRFTEIGVAVVKGNYKGDTVWIGVQEFGLPLSACQQPEVNLKSQIEANKDSLDALEVAIEKKRQEIDAAGPRSPRYSQLVDEYNQMVDQYNTFNDETKNLIVRYNAQINSFNQCVAGT